MATDYEMNEIIQQHLHDVNICLVHGCRLPCMILAECSSKGSSAKITHSTLNSVYIYFHQRLFCMSMMIAEMLSREPAV